MGGNERRPEDLNGGVFMLLYHMGDALLDGNKTAGVCLFH